MVCLTPAPAAGIPCCVIHEVTVVGWIVPVQRIPNIAGIPRNRVPPVTRIPNHPISHRPGLSSLSRASSAPTGSYCFLENVSRLNGWKRRRGIRVKARLAAAGLFKGPLFL